jgi:O-acetyl-ADP-ribose deacetylase (regulator of RNase III)
MRKRIFIGSSGEAMDVCRAIQQELDRDFDATIWDQGVFRPTYDAIDSLRRALDTSDAGIFVLTPDDRTEMRGRVDPTARDNVIFELGMFLGRLGVSRTFVLAPRKAIMHLPTDLGGITVVHYDAERFLRERRAAVGPACTQIALAIDAIAPEVSVESANGRQLDRALTRMSQDLESMVAERPAAPTFEWPGPVSFTLDRATIHLEVGRIQDYHPLRDRQVIVLPANEYFDDGCIYDASGSLGTFVACHFGDRIHRFTEELSTELADADSWRVLRNGRQVAESYGIGEALFLKGLAPEHKVILVSVTTEREEVGLHAEPHFLYAALEGIVETMNEHRLNSLVLPVLGSGHGEISLATAVMFNLLAIRSILSQDRGRHVKEVRLVVFDGDTTKVSVDEMRDIVSRVAFGSRRQLLMNRDGL